MNQYRHTIAGLLGLGLLTAICSPLGGQDYYFPPKGEWGDPGRVDMTFSVTKSYLSTVAGLAVDGGGMFINTYDHARFGLLFPAGGNYIIIDPEHDMVIVTRWLEPAKRAEILLKVIAAVD